MSMPEQVITLIAAMNRVFVPIPVKEIPSFRDKILTYIHTNHPEIIKTIENGTDASDQLKLQVLSAIAEMTQ